MTINMYHQSFCSFRFSPYRATITYNTNITYMYLHYKCLDCFVLQVTTSARKATASPRTLELSRYKPTYEGYQNNYDYGNGYERMPRLIRVISRNARNAVASSRTKELAVPIVRQSMDLVQFDPMAFIIKPTALNAYCPPRISELAQPIVR